MLLEERRDAEYLHHTHTQTYKIHHSHLLLSLSFLNVTHSLSWKKITFAIFFFLLCACVLSCVQLFATPWTLARQAPLSMDFSRREYWSGLPFPSPGNLPDTGIEPVSPVTPILAGRFFYHAATWEDPIFF